MQTKNIDQIDLVERTLPFLEKLQQTIDETIHLGIFRQQRDSLCQ